MLKAVIFDLDGTVLDTREDVADCMNLVLKDLGYKQRTYDEYKQVIGLDGMNFVKRLLGDMPDEKAQYIWDYYIPFVHRYGVIKTKVFDGLKEVLQTLKERGYKLSAFTNKTPDELMPFIPRFLQELGFDDIVGVGGTPNAKPSPNEVFRILKDFGVSPENAYVVGDGETDILTAINAGANPVGVLWGNRSKEQLSLVGAKVFATYPKDLLEVIK